jgi:hypothetical protein
MGVRAKFVVRDITQTFSGGSVSLFPVCRGEENKSWSQATPGGEIKMSILNQPALDWFKQILEDARNGKGKPEVFVDFTSATADDAPIA